MNILSLKTAIAQIRDFAIPVRAGLETVLLAGLLGPFLFYPFLDSYYFQHPNEYLMAAVLCAAVPAAFMTLALNLPVWTLMKWMDLRMGPREMTATLLVLAIFGELLAWLILKGWMHPGEQGKLFLFGLFLITALQAWFFASRQYSLSRPSFPEKN